MNGESMGTRIDLAQKKFGMLTVSNRVSNKGKELVWACICECGGKVYVMGGNLRSGHTKSCGCKKIRAAIENGKKNKTHGMWKTPIYETWRAMIGRCRHDKNYIKRGIKVCDRWLSFDNFMLDMGPRPEGLQLDRVNNDGDYEPSNCRWATAKQQMRNTSKNRMIQIGDELICMTEAAERYGLTPGCLAARLRECRRLPWTIDRITAGENWTHVEDGK